MAKRLLGQKKELNAISGKISDPFTWRGLSGDLASFLRPQSPLQNVIRVVTMATATTTGIPPALVFDDEDDIIRLNVGGKPFATRANTLDLAKSPYFEHLIAAAAKNPKREFFIDRSPDLFALLLEMLRTNELPSEIAVTKYRSLQAEFTFFGVDPTLAPIKAIHDFLASHIEVIATNHASYFVPWFDEFGTNTLDLAELPPCNVKLDGVAIERYRQDETIFITLRAKLIKHITTHVDSIAFDSVACRLDLKRELGFLKILSLTPNNVEARYLLAYKLYIHDIVPSDDFTSHKYSYSDLQTLLESHGDNDHHCLKQWVQSRKVTKNGVTISQEPSYTAFIYHVLNSPTKIICVQNMRIIIESLTCFAIYNHHEHRNINAYTSKAYQQTGFPKRDYYFNVNGDYYTIGGYNKGHYPFLYMLSPKTEAYEHNCFYKTNPAPAIEYTAVEIRSVQMVSFFE